MNNPNQPLNQQTINSAPNAQGTAEATPRAYIFGGVAAVLGIITICIIAVLALSGGALNIRPTPTSIYNNTAGRLEVIGGIPINQKFSLRGVGFAPNERVELFAANIPGAAFSQYARLAEAQALSDGTFMVDGLSLPPGQVNKGTVYLLARGTSSGFSGVQPITIGVVVQPTLPPLSTGTTVATYPPPPSDTPIIPGPTNTPAPTNAPDPDAIGIWFGRYFDNPDLAEPPVFVRNDPNLNFDWKTGSPGQGIPSTYFSVIWTRNEDFKTTDNYLFTLTVDDGARVYVDDTLIINEWRNGGARTVTANHGVSKGVHRIRVEYYQSTGFSKVSLSWGVKYTGWVGRYYNTFDLSGPLILKRDDADINFNWDFGSPAAEVNPDYFSVDWTRTVNFPIGGKWIFTATVDDGARLFIDGNKIFDNYATSGSRTIVGNATLGAGNHQLQLQYVEYTGQAKIIFVWAPQSAPPPTPTSTLGAPTITPPGITPSPTVSPSPTSPAPSATSPAPTNTPTNTATPVPSPTDTPTPTVEPTFTPSPTPT